MKINNGQKTPHINKLEKAVHKKVAALIYWVRDLQQRQGPITYTIWTQKQLLLRVKEPEVEISCAKADLV